MCYYLFYYHQTFLTYIHTYIHTYMQVALKIAPANELAELTNEIGLQSLSKHLNIVEFIEAYAYEVRMYVCMYLCMYVCMYV